MNFFQRLFRRLGSSGGTGDDYTEPRSGLVFPSELGGLRRLATGRRYAEGDRAGESIPYGKDEAQATIYVTTVGQAQFPDGGDSEFIRGELKSAMAAVMEMERLGHYQSVKHFGAAPEALGTDPVNLIWARGALFAVSGGRPMMSFTYITALRNQVIKLRISAPDADKSLTEFPQALGDLISRQRPQPERR
jgi:hypothetical protein